jgi:hypothetical protein
MFYHDREFSTRRFFRNSVSGHGGWFRCSFELRPPRKDLILRQQGRNLYFRAEILTPMPAVSPAVSKRGRTRSTSTPSGRGRAIVPSRFALRFFFRAATLSSGERGSLFPFSSADYVCREPFEWAIVSRRPIVPTERVYPEKRGKKNGGKKERPMERERRSMAYCAVSHVA